MLGAVGGSAIGATIGWVGFLMRKRRCDEARSAVMRAMPGITHDEVINQLASVYIFARSSQRTGDLQNNVNKFYTELRNRDNMVSVNRTATKIANEFRQLHEAASCADAGAEAQAQAELGNADMMEYVLENIIHNECLAAPEIDADT